MRGVTSVFIVYLLARLCNPSFIPYDSLFQWNLQVNPRAVFTDINQAEQLSIRYSVDQAITSFFEGYYNSSSQSTVETVIAQRMFETAHFLRQSLWQLTSSWNDTGKVESNEKREQNRRVRAAETIVYYCGYKHNILVEDIPKVRLITEDIPEDKLRRNKGEACKLFTDGTSTMDRIRYMIDKSLLSNIEYLNKLPEKQVQDFKQCVEVISGDCPTDLQIPRNERLQNIMEALFAFSVYETKVSPVDFPQRKQLRWISQEDEISVLLQFPPIAMTLFSSLQPNVQKRFLYAIKTENYQVITEKYALARLFHVLMINTEMHERVLPEVYLLGVPKAATTSLWKCIAESGAFSKRSICGNTRSCVGKKYYYAGKRSNRPRKEFFFFNHPSLLQLQRSPQWKVFYNDFPLRSTVEDAAVPIDATPNYFGNNNAYLMLYLASRNTSTLRFMVNFRDPIKRAFSSWSMFINWRWRSDTFQEAYQKDIQQLEECFPEIAQGPEAVYNLSFLEYSKKHSKCILGEWKHIVSNGLYVLHLRNWFQYFERSQFHFSFQENLYNQTAQQTVRMAAAATGLSVPESYLKELDDFDAMDHSNPQNEFPGVNNKKQLSGTSVKIKNVCESRTAQQQSHKNGPPEEDIQYLKKFFEPWNKKLQEELQQYGIVVPF
eukprot:TRINITY_DN1620_c0_g3_i1.p1 TRINITY_DN1620_c0_g3~~TRINITY_DN1620_c0_g3_i1.p1  ORF type:complete len:661 (+),score=35.75 TRINITY_DN1620_c0_g3_i1:157-2139(+)